MAFAANQILIDDSNVLICIVIFHSMCVFIVIFKGYEFDVGIHYIGKVGYQSINKTLIDQVMQIFD